MAFENIFGASRKEIKWHKIKVLKWLGTRILTTLVSCALKILFVNLINSSWRITFSAGLNNVISWKIYLKARQVLNFLDLRIIFDYDYKLFKLLLLFSKYLSRRYHIQYSIFLSVTRNNIKFHIFIFLGLYLYMTFSILCFV